MSEHFYQKQWDEIVGKNFNHFKEIANNFESAKDFWMETNGIYVPIL